MGVPGLWDIIRPTGKQRSLTHLAVVDGFEKNTSGKRGYRIGIDASIWFFHATYGKEGENPELRTMFFRLSRLLAVPFLPLFVFDGPKRPAIKRGKRITGKQHWLTDGMKNIINAYGFEWRQAPGEAEAELAYLNRIGIIDAILSDDVDTFLFGARVVIRNPSNTLSGNRGRPVMNADGRDDGNHVVIYRASEIEEDEDVALTQGGFILIGLLAGGDYHQAGLAGCGKNTAHGLARCGFGDQLVDAMKTMSESSLSDFLDEWRESLCHELRTNSRGLIGRKNPSLAASVPDDFPDIEVLRSYVHPITSESEGKRVKPVEWAREHSLAKLAGVCELYFEWGVKDKIIKRFRTVLWHGSVLRILRKAAMDVDERTRTSSNRPPTTPTKSKRANPGIATGSPSQLIASYFSSLAVCSPSKDHTGSESDSDDADGEPLIIKIHSSRTHASTDGLLEYRLEVAPQVLVKVAESGLKGLRVPEEGHSDDEIEDEWDDEESGDKGKKAPPDPDSHIRVWLPASMVRLVERDLTEKFEVLEEKKKAKKAGKGKAAAAKGKVAKGKMAIKAAAIADLSSSEEELIDLDTDLPEEEESTHAVRGNKSTKESTRERPTKGNALAKSKAKAKGKKGDGEGEEEAGTSVSSRAAKASADDDSTQAPKSKPGVGRQKAIAADKPVSKKAPIPKPARAQSKARALADECSENERPSIPAKAKRPPPKPKATGKTSSSRVAEVQDLFAPSSSQTSTTSTLVASESESEFFPASSGRTLVPSREGSIFDSDDDDLFSGSLPWNKKAAKPPAQSKTNPGATKRSAVHHGLSDDSDVTVSNPKSPRQSKAQCSPPRHRVAGAISLLSSDDEDSFSKIGKSLSTSSGLGAPLMLSRTRSAPAKSNATIKEVIEISSDSSAASPPPKPKKAVSLPSRAAFPIRKEKSSSAGGSKKQVALPTPALRALSSDGEEFIDLT
ncbi:hypothetical protein BOTBODRAFT_172612 [Botryobasidium botryosum FD-172 SS1]|uniref:XPG-I domain-containing protein n=1 Tax=Botryobasidium botryosum (strain FD-172 SS1) TaxID=930990 RepID=A0A067MQL4_BOTB1|nr:hypothetical protein BOTBODRAFT_172612 [Botryobasidium botryosum FD-172 SS1]